MQNLPVYRFNQPHVMPNGRPALRARIVPGLRAANLPPFPAHIQLAQGPVGALPAPQMAAAAQMAPRPPVAAAAPAQMAPRPPVAAPAAAQMAPRQPVAAAPRPYAQPYMHPMAAAAPRPYAQPYMHPMAAAAPRPYAQPYMHPMAAAPRPYAQPYMHPMAAAPRPYAQPQYQQYMPQFNMQQLAAMLMQQYAAIPPQPAAGPLLPLPPPPPLNPRTLIQNQMIQLAILNCLTSCHNALYDPAFVEETRALLSAAGSETIMGLHAANEHPFKATHLFKLIVKGGNAAVFNEEKGPHARAENIKGYPLSLINDLDVSLLINPALGLEDFIKIRNKLMKKLLQTMHAFLQDNIQWPHILQAYRVTGVHFMPLMHRIIMHYHEESPVVAENAETNTILQDPEYQDIPEGCPFMMAIHRNVTFFKQVVGANGQPGRVKIEHDLSLIQMGTRALPETFLFEVSVPSKSFVHLDFEWQMSNNHWLLDDFPYTFFIMNPIGTYFDQKYASAANTRPQKRLNRTRRAVQLKQRIVNRKVANGTLSANYNAKRAVYRTHKNRTQIAQNELD
jgi:hypothetical protein